MGLCELNGWGRLERGGYLSQSKAATPLLVTRAAAAGFAYAHLFEPTGHPYALGVVARSPIEVVSEVGPPTFERGLLHVRLPHEPGFTGHPGRARGGKWKRTPTRAHEGSEEDEDAHRRTRKLRVGRNEQRQRWSRRRALSASSSSSCSSSSSSSASSLSSISTSPGLDIVLAHLNAHDATARLQEARFVQQVVSDLSGMGRPALVMGDFNARLGGLGPGEEDIIGPFAFEGLTRTGDTATNRDLLMECCHVKGLLVTGSYFDRPPEFQVTCYNIGTRPMDTITSKTFAQLDHILAHAICSDLVTDSWSDRRFAMNSHHFPVFATLRTTFEREPRPQKACAFDVRALGDEASAVRS